jgi:HEAT repeat protein
MLAAVMPRLNDHVYQVRDAARRAVETLLPFATSDELLGFLGFTWRMRSFSRVDHSEWISKIHLELSESLTVDQLLDALRSDNPMVARGTFCMLVQRDLIPTAELLKFAIESRNDIVVARQAAQLALSLPPAERESVLRAGMHSHYGPVRTLVLRGLLEFAPDALEIAHGMLLDAQGSVRSVAQFYLRKNCVDLASYYRNVLRNLDSKTNLTCIALAALGNLGGEDDVRSLQEKAESGFPSVRRAACLAWLKLVPADKDVIALALLSDDSRLNRKLAASMATRQGAFIPFERVREVLKGKHDLTVLLAFARLRKWDWIETVASEALRLKEGSSEWEILVNETRNWLAHAAQSYEIPGKPQRERLLSTEVVQALERLCGRDHSVLRYELDLISKC